MDTFFVLLSLCAGNHRSPVDCPHKATVTRTFDVSLLSARTNCLTNSMDRWFQTSWRSFDVVVLRHGKGPFLKDWIARKEAELTYNVDDVDKTLSMASSAMHEGLGAANMSTYENLCKTVDILSLANNSLAKFRKLDGYERRNSKYVYVISSIQARRG